MNLLWYVFASFDTVWAVHGEVFQEGRVFSRGACGTMMCFHLTPEHVHLLAALLFETVMLLPLSLPLQTLFIHLTLMLRFLELPCISLIRNLLPPFPSDIRLILFLIFPVLTEFLGESLSPFIPFVGPDPGGERSLVYGVCAGFKYKGNNDRNEKRENYPNPGIRPLTAPRSIERISFAETANAYACKYSSTDLYR